MFWPNWDYRYYFPILIQLNNMLVVIIIMRTNLPLLWLHTNKCNSYHVVSFFRFNYIFALNLVSCLNTQFTIFFLFSVFFLPQAS